MKDPHDAKIEHFLEKAVFTLHQSFQDPVRTVSKPPFKLSEQGYGSFQIQIELFFKVSLDISNNILQMQSY